jgi:hypothetical protein
MLAQSLISSVVPPNESVSINLRYDPFHEGNAVREPAVTGKERSWCCDTVSPIDHYFSRP